MASLSPDDLIRYARQIRMPQVSVDGQAKLKAGAVLIVGAGGLGSPAALYLAAAGVGRIGLVDGDRVEISNLQRQILYGTADIGRAKTAAGAERLGSTNPTVSIETVNERVTSANALDLVRAYDVVIDGTDNFPTRYLLSDACVLAARPLVYGSVDRFEGQVSVLAHGGPCYRCLYPTPPEPGTVQNCADAGVLGVLPGLIGTMQATEALKLLLGIGEPLVGRLLMVDALGMRFRAIGIDADPSCPACGTRAITALADYDALCGAPPAASGAPSNDPSSGASRETWSNGSNDPSSNATSDASNGASNDAPIATVSPRALAAELENGNPITLIDVREPFEWRIGRIAGAQLIPLGALERAPGSVDREADVVVYCHHGMRSEAAAYALRGAGVARVRNLVGGIDRWSREVDPSVPRY